MTVGCGPSVQASAMRIAVLEADGVPLPGAGNLYVTEALTKLDATPVYSKGVDMEKQNAAGNLCVNYKARDVLRRFDLALEVCTFDPDLERILAGGEKFTSAGTTIGGSSPAVGVIENPYGVSVELWSKHLLGGDLDPVWPYIHWVLPRSYWQPDKVTWDNNPMARPFSGWTTENTNWFNGPLNDWAFSSDRSIAWCFVKASDVPTPVCGAQTLVGS